MTGNFRLQQPRHRWTPSPSAVFHEFIFNVMTTSSAIQTRAIVCHDTLANNGWRLQPVQTRPIKDDELLVEIVASGICHTDVIIGGLQDNGKSPIGFYPRVLGHEGEPRPFPAPSARQTDAPLHKALATSKPLAVTSESQNQATPSSCPLIHAVNAQRALVACHHFVMTPTTSISVIMMDLLAVTTMPALTRSPEGSLVNPVSQIIVSSVNDL